MISGKHTKWITKLMIGLIIVSFLTGIGIQWNRASLESTWKNVEIMVSGSDLEILSGANQLPIEEVLKRFQEAGVTTVILREKSLGDLEKTGEIKIYKGFAFAKEYLVSVDPENYKNSVFIEVLNPAYQNQVNESLLSKQMGRAIEVQGKTYLEMPVKTAVVLANDGGYQELLDEIGIGFNGELIKALNQTSLYQVPQARAMSNYQPAALDFLAGQLATMENISFVLNNDSSVLGHPSHITQALQVLSPEGKYPIGMVEFFNQAGLSGMINRNQGKAVRVHSISDREMVGFSVNKALERYLLAVEERNIRAVYLKMFYMKEPMSALGPNLEFVEKMKNQLVENGFTPGQASVIRMEGPGTATKGILLLGILAGAVLLFTLLGTPVVGIFAGAGLAAFILLLLVKGGGLAPKMASLLAVLIFPALSFAGVFGPVASFPKKSLVHAIVMTIALSVVTFTGAILMASMLTSTPFLIKTEQFSGVKIAHMIPLAVIPFLLLFWNKEGWNNIKGLLNMAITYKIALAGGVAVVVMAYYLLRTGNQGAGLVLGIEDQLRNALNQSLGVRPRTKEFLIGYPFLVLLAYLGLSIRSWPLLFPAIIGQISLANTYAHLHTPLVISLTRSVLGITIGLFLGILLVIFWKGLSWVYERYGKPYFADFQRKL